MSSSSNAPGAGPRDGPALVFEADPMVAPLVEKDSDFESFGIVLVAGWPFLGSNSSTRETYQEIVTAAKNCFDSQDIEADSVYVYPPEALHVTIASFHTIQQQPELSREDQTTVMNFWKGIVDAASQNEQWPKTKLKLTLEKSQIGTRAGIFLWKETTGGIDSMRNCIRSEIQKVQADTVPTLTSAPNLNILTDTISIPPIVHTTFLRFYKTPTTDGAAVQQRFQTNVVPLLLPLQRQSTPLDPSVLAKLVVERTPYMHIPDDDHHVLSTFRLKHFD